MTLITILSELGSILKLWRARSCRSAGQVKEMHRWMIVMQYSRPQSAGIAGRDVRVSPPACGAVGLSPCPFVVRNSLNRNRKPGSARVRRRVGLNPFLPLRLNEGGGDRMRRITFQFQLILAAHMRARAGSNRRRGEETGRGKGRQGYVPHLKPALLLPPHISPINVSIHGSWQWPISRARA